MTTLFCRIEMKCHDAILNIHKECFRLVKSIRNPEKKTRKIHWQIVRIFRGKWIMPHKTQRTVWNYSNYFFSLVLFLIKIDFHIEVDEYFQHVFSFMFQKPSIDFRRSTKRIPSLNRKLCEITFNRINHQI